jgi:hypothetical protein
MGLRAHIGQLDVLSARVQSSGLPRNQVPGRRGILIVNNQFSQSQCSKKFEIERRVIPQCASNLPTKVINSGAVDGFCEGELELRTFFLAGSGAKINHRH